MKKKRRGIFCTLLFLALLMMMPAGASAAVRKSMLSAMRHANKGYTIFAYNKTGGTARIYKRTSFSKGAFSTLENGGAVVVNMKKVNSLLKNRKNKTLQWIPVNTKYQGRWVIGYVYAGSYNLAPINFQKISSNRTVKTALNYGYRYLGTPFLLGGGSISRAIDCANFVKRIYEAAGKRMPYPHTYYLQTVARDVSVRNLKAGDLLFYLKNDTSGPIDHVAVYLGRGLMINASGHYGSTYPQGGITVKRINYGKRKPVRCMRLNGIA